jgi:hypothetical protein
MAFRPSKGIISAGPRSTAAAEKEELAALLCVPGAGAIFSADVN